MLARACYIPYGTTLFRGLVDDIAHPIQFFRFISLVFSESPFAKDLFVARFKDQKWFDEKIVVLSGSPKTGLPNRKEFTRRRSLEAWAAERHQANSMDAPMGHLGRYLPFFLTTRTTSSSSARTIST
jgi:hypothetical protein